MIQTNSIFDKINFNGGNLSSDGGSILLSQFLEKINLKKLLDSIPFVDLRHLPPSLFKHEYLVSTNHQMFTGI